MKVILSPFKYITTQVDAGKNVQWATVENLWVASIKRQAIREEWADSEIAMTLSDDDALKPYRRFAREYKRAHLLASA